MHKSPFFRSPFLALLLSGQRRRCVVGKLLLLYRGTLYADVVEEHAGDDDGLGNGAERVRDVGVVADGDDAGAEAAVIEFVEDCAADELAAAPRFYGGGENGEA